MNKPDILERLYNHPCEDNPDYGPLLCGLRVEAAEEIKTLRVRIAALEAALLRIGPPGKKIVYCRDGHEEAVLLARAALGEKE
ncbi:hypothetical protein [Caudoviricetes sp.]|nr:hypothetical protein [Caudoviricetes sp.]UOF81520.1 hypothetical protein [Caudoviricetes sp.]